jgi:2-polyprenyl-6-methoxyphenol hydroxylase-like FAD-dependent oxidoreductase
VNEIRSWESIGFLEVQVNRLRRWHRPGLLCIGDAAHASSPVAGFGANLAIQDAVAAANAITGPLLRGRVTSQDLARVKHRRQLPTVVTQAIQAIAQRDIVEIPDPLTNPRLDTLPTTLRLDEPPASRLSLVNRIFGRLAGQAMLTGLRGEHVRVGAAAVASPR